MKILFIGSVIRTADCTKFLGPSVAGNKMQIGIIKGLMKDHQDITVVTEVPIAAFPKEKRLFIRSGNIALTDQIDAKKVPFINIFILKQITMIISAFRILKKWCKENNLHDKVIISFNAYPYISIPIMLVTRFFKVKTFCIFADPPIDQEKRKIFSRIAKQIEESSTIKNVKKYQGIIVLNEKSIEKYAPNSKYILIDGGFDLDDLPQNQPGGQWIKYSKGDTIRIIFSGALYEYNGIIQLVEAFQSINDEKVNLEIFGNGQLKEYVIKASQNDARIRYMGNVPNNEMIIIQQNAGLLINPRPVDNPISLYTFPSKMIEYMLSGTPVITTKLNGLTDEYLKNVFLIQDSTPIEIAKAIQEAILHDRDFMINKASNAREFIIKNKTWDSHSSKINEFINTI